MRVIGGIAKGRKLFSLPGLNTRPTLDRVKEALFNILQFEIKNATILDLFSGSGALGIEALSRGAAEAVFCDNSREAIEIIKRNIENTKLTKKAIVLNKDFKQALESLKDTNKFKIIFLDPPYKSDYGVKAIEKILEYNLLLNDGTIILETNEEKEGLLGIKGIRIDNKRKYGKVYLLFIRKE